MRWFWNFEIYFFIDFLAVPRQLNRWPCQVGKQVSSGHHVMMGEKVQTRWANGQKAETGWVAQVQVQTGWANGQKSTNTVGKKYKQKHGGQETRTKRRSNRTCHRWQLLPHSISYKVGIALSSSTYLLHMCSSFCKLRNSAVHRSKAE